MDNIDAPALNNMTGGLDGLISSRGYQPASPADVQGVNLNGGPEPGQVTSTGQPFASVPTVTHPVAPSVTPSQPPAQSEPNPAIAAEMARLRDIAYQAASTKIQAEEATFEASIAHLDEDTQEYYRLRRENEQTREVNAWLNNRLTGIQQTAEQREQDRAKNLWGFIRAREYNLPYENPAVKAALHAAGNKDEMAQIAANLQQVIGSNRANQARHQMTNGTFAAGGNNGRVAPAAPLRNDLRSGRLDNLISQRGYTVVPQ
jgi:hypothetical protein